MPLIEKSQEDLPILLTGNALAETKLSDEGDNSGVGRQMARPTPDAGLRDAASHEWFVSDRSEEVYQFMVLLSRGCVRDTHG